ncbi:MAG: glutaredoxin domain-containing protein, partial [Candidatus Nanoarchaeia archaeon]
MVKVKVYTTPTCPYCDMAKQFLREHNVKFEAVDVS